MKYLLGYDIGSSSVKACLLDAELGIALATVHSPNKEMGMVAHKAGWAEQNPENWWKELIKATQKLKKIVPFEPADVQAIGISYQMHGLVLIDKQQKVLRPSIIWCDSRAVEYGNQAFKDLGEDFCLQHYLNSPGNFTASKLKWVKENEPTIYSKIKHFLLPGDFIAMKMSGVANTTISGLSEGVFWDYHENNIANDLMNYYGISSEIVAPLVPTFAYQSELTSETAKQLGLKAGIPITYRAGDQPNNAFSLNVLQPGELAATAGTSGVVYGISDKNSYDQQSRVNAFVHVNNSKEKTRNGILMCINGTGILNSWTRKLISTKKNISYSEINELAAKAPIGSSGLCLYPFGNGAERIFENRDLGASVKHLNFNIHQTPHFLRAAQEGIVFSFQYGLEIMQKMGLSIEKVKAGHANMFLSSIFQEAFVNTSGANVELYETDGAQGAARGAGKGINVYKSDMECFVGLKK